MGTRILKGLLGDAAEYVARKLQEIDPSLHASMTVNMGDCDRYDVEVSMMEGHKAHATRRLAQSLADYYDWAD